MTSTNDYVNWLKWSIQTDIAHPSCFNDILIDALLHVPFKWTIPMDRNREQDGLYLRKMNNYYSFEPCSMFEMMVALSLRIDQEFLGDTSTEGISRAGLWFGEMCDNLDISNCSGLDEFEVKINRFLNHEYEPDGRGSLFYVPNAPEDFRQLQIWDQMGAWIINKTQL